MNRFVKDTALLLRSAAWIFFLFFLGAGFVHAQTSISDVKGNPGKYRGQTITVQGKIAEHVESGGDTETKNYIIEDEAGNKIRARTTKAPPSLDAQYEVDGVVEISPFNRNPVLDEQARVELTNTEAKESSESLREGFSLITVYLILGLGALVVVVLAYFAYASQEQPTPQQAPTPSEDGAVDDDSEPSSDLSSTELGGDGEESDTGFPEPSGQRIKSESSSSQTSEEDSEGPETLKFKAPPKTMKFVPGRLVVAAGPDQGKEFRIAGRPTPEGNVVTIGRAEVEGEKAFAHIQLGDTYRTVSRMQAEIIQKDDKILLKNTSETNPTIVNGDNLPAGETLELQDGDMIRMGELMVRYERD